MKHAHAARSMLPHSTHGFAHPARNVGALGIAPGMVIADFGSGSGAYVLAIAELLAGSGKVYAVDVQKDLLRRTHNEAIKRGFSSVHILWGDLEKPYGSKLADKSCDVVLISNLLFQVEDKREVMREAKRVLRPRGTLAIIDWQESFGGLGPIKEHVFDKSSALSVASATGFVFYREFNAGAHHYGLLFHLEESAQ
jgi:ubiquinone/menaquinone biosynthesis C-methylase UbiE